MQLENVWVNLKLARELGLQRAILYGVLQEHMQEYDSKKGMEKQLSVYADELGVCESSIKKMVERIS